MEIYSFSKNKITRSFILISFIYNLKIKRKCNILPEIHLVLSAKKRVFNTLLLTDDARSISGEILHLF